MTTTGPVLGRRAAGGDLVREVRPVDDRHAPVRALVQPGGPAAVGGADRLGRVRHDRARVLRAGRRAPRRAPRHRRRRRSCTTRPARSPSRAARCADWRAGECEPVPGPHDARPDRRRARLRRGGRAVGGARPAGRAARRDASRARRGSRTARSQWLAARNGRVRGGAADGRPSLERAEQVAEAILALSGVTNGRLAVAGFRSLEERCGVPLADLAEGAEETRITFQDAQVQPRRVITSPEWSGIDEEGRAYAAFTINVERDKPWHTLSGRMHLYLDHAWMRELGEGAARLPAAGRPPADARRRAADRRRRRPGGHAALPDAALEVVDPLRVPGQPAHAHAVPRRLGAVDEPAGRRGDRRRATTTGSRRTTATASSSRAWSSRTACRRACA